ncbi:uncharacterized protein LOC133531559 [Cydia pomonella]|uniref:uncharacterized protein LOC133531559 n=1 Tax=Cydia pomonella TaxID=82600 RepID=UPI002ADD4F25|nr:uncharacterized protein LOC133531559 [Cydia pomonella]
MSLEEKDPIYLDICHQLDAFCKRVEEKVDKDQQQLKARKKNTELEEKLALEMKKNAELLRQLEEVSSRYTELDRLCAMFPGQLTISDNDQTRLDQAKLSYEVAKELTGVRFDYTAPPNICKGYVKSESRKLLQPFNLEGDASAALWRLAEAGAAPEWRLAHNENLPPN